MTSKRTMRYGVWNAPDSQLLATTPPITWRVTPQSKELVDIPCAVTLPGCVRYVAHDRNSISVQVPRDLKHRMMHWACAGAPAGTLPPSWDHNTCTLYGPPGFLDADFSDVPCTMKHGDVCRVRISVSPSRIASGMSKILFSVVDVLVS